MFRHPGRLIVPAVAIALWSAAAFGFPTSRLTYLRGKGAEACPDEATVRQAVAARLGYDPFFPSADKTIVARIVRNRDELRASVELVDAKSTVRGVREFKAAPGQCDELVATMALAISIAIDPTNPGILGGEPARNSPDPPQHTSSTETTPLPPSTPAIEPPVTADRVGERVLRPEVPAQSTPASPGPRAGAMIFAAVGTAPSFTTGFGASGSWRVAMWSLALEGRGELPASTPAAGGELRTWLFAGGVAACAHIDPVFLCGTAWLGSMQGEGVRFPNSRFDSALYAAAGGRAGLELPLAGQFTFRPQLELLTTLNRAALQIDGVTQWTAPPWAVLLGAGLVGRFP